MSKSLGNKLILIWSIAGIFLLYGLFSILTSLDSNFETTSHEGILVEATGSSGIRGLHNNTTLRIEKADGRIEEREVKSSHRFGDIAKIRDQARTFIGKRIVYYTKGNSGSGRLVSVRSVGGDEIVSAEHTLRAQRFTGWATLIGGAVLGLLSFVPGIFGRSRREYPPN
ncbi:MAG: hypothetical protein NXH72_10935 [Hyphomonadaceae bacterium]|nr:hypothetical protein [Hyphomonadaceae bacterium]